MTQETLDLSNIPDGTIEELHRQAETCLQNSMHLAIAADSRATMLGTIFCGGSVALLAAVATIIAGGSAVQLRSAIAALLVTAISFLIATAFCVVAGRPTEFFISGYEPRDLARSATQDRFWMLRYVTEDIQKRIDANKLRLQRSADLLNSGLIAASVGIVGSAALFWFIV